ncbi:unnamed protein product [Mytilus coruscus]|uniref:Integrase catalytic domain-containing protein n=1 Tax=Mytilus coruscus TaxID=42192 RepID=A0A6J8AKT9_MYTCO|nr:unnamed protein product [Mytilus coruscus]
MFSRVGIPQTILTDQGSNFKSQLLADLYEILGAQGCTTSPYRPQSNGRCERFNGTLKSMLKKLCTESAEEWDELVPYALFAYREVPHEETGFSPFELLYGWPVRGPMAILRGLFTREDEMHRSVIEHVITIRDCLADMSEIVKENLSHRKEKIKAWYVKRARFREFELGDEVLLLLPSEASKMKAMWKGPFRVIRRLNDVNYCINVGGRREPGLTDLITHDVRTTSENPITLKPYRIPHAIRADVKLAIDEMLELGVIEPSISPWSAPIVPIRKHDGTLRICVDYRKINQITIFDAYPIPRMEELFEKLGEAKFISRLDMTKGYFQVPLAENARVKSFKDLKRALSEAPVLATPDFNKPFILQTDASDAALGAVLSQNIDGNEHPISYISRKLLPREQHFATIERNVWQLFGLSNRTDITYST